VAAGVRQPGFAVPTADAALPRRSCRSRGRNDPRCAELEQPGLCYLVPRHRPRSARRRPTGVARRRPGARRTWNCVRPRRPAPRRAPWPGGRRWQVVAAAVRGIRRPLRRAGTARSPAAGRPAPRATPRRRYLAWCRWHQRLGPGSWWTWRWAHGPDTPFAAPRQVVRRRCRALAVELW